MSQLKSSTQQTYTPQMTNDAHLKSSQLSQPTSTDLLGQNYNHLKLTASQLALTDREGANSALSLQKLELGPSQQSLYDGQQSQGGVPLRHCDICQRPIYYYDPNERAGPASIGSSTLLCGRCQEDILNSNRLIRSHM